jgi:preprotein translocase subunit SecG
MGIIITISTVLFLILCVLLNIVILLQSEKSAGMGILGGSSQSAFGSSTADVISKATAVMIALFMLGSLGLAGLESARSSSIKEELLKSPGAAQGAPAGVEANPVQKNKTEQSQPKR